MVSQFTAPRPVGIGIEEAVTPRNRTCYVYASSKP